MAPGKKMKSNPIEKWLDSQETQAETPGVSGADGQADVTVGMPKANNDVASSWDTRVWDRNLNRLLSLADAPISEYQQLFDEALDILDGESSDDKQDLILSLGSESGWQVIRRVVEGEVFDTSFAPFYTSFLSILTHEELDHPVMLERTVEAIYFVLYGQEGSRGIGFLNTLVGSFEEDRYKDIPSHILASTFLPISTFLLNIVKFNKDSLRRPEFPEFVKRIEKICPKSDECFRDITDKLEQVDLLLTVVKISKSTLEKKKSAKLTAPPASDREDFPGSLSYYGKRHDNDSARISKIAILPTSGEVLSKRQDFRPKAITVPDANHHLTGIQRLFDTQFRLLREESIGEIKAAIRMVFDDWHMYSNPIYFQDRPKRIIKVNNGGSFIRIFHNATVSMMTFDRRNGPVAIMTFDQPSPPNSYSEGNRRLQWWGQSRELQEGSLVALVNNERDVLFLTVSRRFVRRAGGQGPEEDVYSGSDALSPELKNSPVYDSNGAILKDLAGSRDRSTIFLGMADPDRAEDISKIFEMVGHRSKAVLVEFPGVMAASFQAVLKCLQGLSVKPTIPFANWLQGPSEATPASIRPPKYLTKNDETLDLTSITHDKTPLTFSIESPVTMEDLRKHTTLDEGQSVALLAALQRELALIQGPPGTGKSYVGVQLAKILLDNKYVTMIGPIVCVCYTNHALDQFLEDLMDAGVPGKSILRLGSRTQSERVAKECSSIKEVGESITATKAEKQTLFNLNRDLDELVQKMKDIAKKTNALQHEPTIKAYLSKRYRELHDLFYPPDAVDPEGFTVKATSKNMCPITHWAQSTTQYGLKPEMPMSRLHELGPKIFHIEGEYRRRIHDQWLDEMRKELLDDVYFTLIKKHQELIEEVKACHKERDRRGLQEMNVIGATTTGLATYSPLLRMLKAKVLICEEAAEVLEAHVLTALLPSVQHAILIGDHLQLRPQINNFVELSAESRAGAAYRLDESLFERLASQMPLAQLDTQRRMHPSISELIRSTLYPSLTDYPSTAEYPEVVGMRKRLFWLDHHHTEDGFRNDMDDPNNTSKTNAWEVEMVMGLMKHIQRQGVYKSGKIAVITPYAGQLRLLQQKMSDSFEVILNEKDEAQLEKQDPNSVIKNGPKVGKGRLLDSLRIATVDNFQGEEADIIIISLVRSNPRGNCGFLKTSNRINVLLSRARHGMYIIGDSNTARRNVPMWDQVIRILAQNGNLSNMFDLSCSRHPEKRIFIVTPGDFSKFSPEGGCALPCGRDLECGHPCPDHCHSEAMHNSVACQEPCTRTRKTCNHVCSKKCFESCANCPVIVNDIELSCGHIQETMPCWQSHNLEAFHCRKQVHKKLPFCEHSAKMDCSLDPKDYLCQETCREILSCGHMCSLQCNHTRFEVERGETIKSIHDALPCRVECRRPRDDCEHTCKESCHPGSGCPPCWAPASVKCTFGHVMMGVCADAGQMLGVCSECVKKPRRQGRLVEMFGGLIL
ncbi:P-loop containing nucleoside triphosphate hydrolase protein [Ascobolus immersus RN42]|uniref:P-loop containing nucleoside triphosphate hydrolase protein n=1 Tax=Ascobolus immersus RN42 TaxID=1160509 RepID=A0A3N4IP10_ASCIM|nr:P-loop containing nucleoside triphosphate hydrolase protein [Ascobolus immersus RN42]